MNFRASFLRPQLAALLLLLAFSPARAQQGGSQPRLERIEAARVAYLTEKLSLTSEQAQRFWPVYNEYTDKRRSLRKQGRPGGPRRPDFATMSDKEIREAINDQFATRQSELNLEKEYLDKFQKVISLRQVALLYQAERDFTKELLKRLDGRRPGARPSEQ